MYHIVGARSIENFKSLIKMNMIKNCLVTIEDLDIEEKIFGPDASTLKRKSTRTRPNVVVNNEIDIPPEIYENHSDLDLCMEIIFVNEMLMMTTIDTTIRFRALILLSDRLHDDLYHRLDNVLRYYIKAGF